MPNWPSKQTSQVSKRQKKFQWPGMEDCSNGKIINFKGTPSRKTFLQNFKWKVLEWIQFKWKWKKHWVTQICTMLFKISSRTRDVAQWYSICLTVQGPGLRPQQNTHTSLTQEWLHVSFLNQHAGLISNILYVQSYIYEYIDSIFTQKKTSEESQAWRYTPIMSALRLAWAT
jgi:hypothetical protein